MIDIKCFSVGIVFSMLYRRRWNTYVRQRWWHRLR